MTASTALRALRGRLLWFVDDPETAGEVAHRYVADGLLVVENGLVQAAGEAKELLRTLPADAEIVDHRPHLIMPGFIDAHIHMPQTQVIAPSFGFMKAIGRPSRLSAAKDWFHAVAATTSPDASACSMVVGSSA